MPKISFTIHTASFDTFLKEKGVDSYFESVVECLKRQTFNDFEFIYIDTFYEENKDKFSAIDAPFLIKHVPLHHRHRYWFNLGHSYIAAAKNTGILYANGELVVACDDAEFFPDNFLEKYWTHYQNGCLMHAFHKRLRNIKTEDGKVVFPIEGKVYINDSRQRHPPVHQHSSGDWLYAGTSFDLKAGLVLNGFNEKMDGCKSLEDAEFGLRLKMLGKKFVLDQNEGFLYILDHENDGSERSGKTSDLIAVENYGVLQCSVEHKETRANSQRINNFHKNIISRETLKYRGFDPFVDEHKLTTDIWLGVPSFDLRQERKDLRRTLEWNR